MPQSLSMKRSLATAAAALVLAVGTPTNASLYYTVAPVSVAGSGDQMRPVVLALVTAVLPPAQVGREYRENLHRYLSIDGPQGTDPTSVEWTLVAGDLPAGLDLSPAGIVSGVPTAVQGLVHVTVEASYPGQRATARQAYTIAQVSAGIAQFSGYRAFADGTLAQSCEGYRRPSVEGYQ
jgi:hypothetical protein